MKCANCNVNFNDGVQCGSCKRHLDFGCANITEVGWRKLGIDRRAVWKCPQCRLSSPTSAPVEPISFEVAMLGEMNDIKKQLSSLPTLVKDLKNIKDELKDLKNSCEFNSAKFDEFTNKLAGIESKMEEYGNLENKFQSFEEDLAKLKEEQAANDRRSRLNNVEIKGVPLKKDENLFDILNKISQNINFAFPKTQVNFVTRIPLFNSNDKSILVSFLNRYIKEDFVAAARANKTLSSVDLGYQGSSRRIYINDHLNSESKKLLTRTKLLAAEKLYKYVWVKHGKFTSGRMIPVKSSS